MAETAIQPTERRAIVPITNGRLAPSDFEGMWRIATALSKSGLLPRGLSTPEQAFVMVNAAMELGIGYTDAISGIGVINGRPILHSRLPTLLMQRHPSYAGMETKWVGLDKGGGLTEQAVCTVTVKRMQRLADGTFQTFAYDGVFGWQDCKAAGLLGKETYKQYGRDMIESKARKRAIDKGFADALGGMASTTMEDDDEVFTRRKVANEAPTATAATSKLDELVEQPEPVAVPPVVDAFDPHAIAAEMEKQTGVKFTLAGDAK